MEDIETPPAKKEFYIPGSLSIHVQKDKEPIRQLHNLDGFRICEHTDTIHYNFFDGKSWIKNVLTGYKLKAMRANWGHRETVDATYSFTLYMLPTGKSLKVVGVRLSMFHEERDTIEYCIGDVSSSVQQTSYFGTPQPSLDNLINACIADIKTCGFSCAGDLIDNLLAFSNVCGN